LADPFEVKRRLAAIFAADVEGYSRLMGADEVATLDTLTARREILDGLMACHAMAGRVEEARRAWVVARQIDPTQRISIVMNRLRSRRWRPEINERYVEAYRIAGMPE
jgi:class 3 adenylate cyclase